MTTQITKQQLLKSLGRDQSEVEAAMLELGIDYDNETYTQQDLEDVACHLNVDLNVFPSALPPAINPSTLAITDDEVLKLAESTGVDLEVVMNAAIHIQSLEALVEYVEEYKELQSKEAIKTAARQQFKSDQLRKKEQELGERLTAALTSTPVDIAKIQKRLGIILPKELQELASWNGQPGSEGEPDFLKKARESFTKAS